MANSRASRKLAAIRRRLPASMKAPAQLEAFVDLVTDPKVPARDRMNVTWSDPRPLLNADKTATEAFVPFLLFADGGVVALWAQADALRVAWCDSEGQSGVLAQDFGDFLALLAAPGPELLERLELDAPLDTRALAPRRKPRVVPAAMKRAFAAWVASHALDAKTPKTPAGDALRDALQATARRMLEDGLSKVHKITSARWSMSFRLAETAGKWNVTYVDYGVWRDLPAKYGFAALLPALLAAMKTRKTAYELSIVSDGHVFADRGNELALKP